MYNMQYYEVFDTYYEGKKISELKKEIREHF